MSSFKEQLSELVVSSGIQSDDWLNEVFEFYLSSKSQKPRGIQKYVGEVQQLEDLTSQVKDLFKTHLKKVLRDEEKHYQALTDLQNELDEVKQNSIISNQKYEALTQKYELLKSDIQKHKDTVELLNKTIKEKDQQMAQDRKTIATFEKLISTSEIRISQPDENEQTDQKGEDKPKRGRRGRKPKPTSDELPSELSGKFKVQSIPEETERLQEEAIFQKDADRQNYGPTILKENFSIESSTSERPLETSHKD